MLSKSKQKLIRSLALKKKRDELGLFVAEGGKTVRELLACFSCHYLAATQDFIRETVIAPGIEVDEVSSDELARLSLQQHPQQVVAIFAKPSVASPEAYLQLPVEQLCLALDGVQDPGNVGTIVRIADWYGIGHIFCTSDTADIFSPKTVQSTMGSLGRVQVHYGDLRSWLAALPQEVPVYGTFLDGQVVMGESLTDHGVILMGSEGRGIRQDLQSLVTKRLFIPRYPYDKTTPESLNVAVSTAIICQEFRRARWIK